MKVGIAGSRSTIAREAIALRPNWSVVHGEPRHLPPDLDAYLVCTGYLAGQPIKTIKTDDAVRTFELNFLSTARMCEHIVEVNDRARICVIGSESGFKGSYDMAYAGAKAAMHLYVETKVLRTPEQLLFAIAPSIIADSGMTERRPDYGETMQRGLQTRLGRWLRAREVAALAVQLLESGSPALSGTIVRMRP